MSYLHRVLCPLTILTGAGLLLMFVSHAPLSTANAQLKDTPPPPFPGMDPPPTTAVKSDAFSLPLDRTHRRTIEAAQDYIDEQLSKPVKDQDWKEVVQLLQVVLDLKEDTFYLHPADPKKRLPERWTSTRAEAERLVLSLPPSGRDFYVLQHEPLAQRMLKDARAANDPHMYTELVRRFLATPSGAEALDQLGTLYLDRGEPELAAHAYQRRLERGDKVSSLTLYKAVLAYHSVRDTVREQDAWNALGKQLNGGPLRLGNRAYIVEQLREQVGRWNGLPSAAGESAMFRGDLSRSARGGGETPYLDPKRRIPLTEMEDGRLWLKQAAENAPPNAVPLPGFAPVAAGDRLFYRSHSGVHAFDAKQGKELWHTPSPLGMDSVLRDPAKKVQMRDWFASYRSARNVLIENTLTGTLSTDGRRVYGVEDVAVPPHPDMIYSMQFNQQRYFGPLTDMVHPNKLHNKLRALNADTGRVEWEAGGNGQAVHPDLAGVMFLGPPLPLGNSLFVVVEQRQELRLVCLRADRGDVQWVQPLGTPRDKILLDVLRRTQAVQPAYAEGVLVCPTGGGAVVAVDPLSRTLLWAHVYRDRPAAPVDPNGFQVEYNPDAIQNCWKLCAPIIADGRVVITAPDGDSVRCLDLRTGAALWKASRTEEDLYVGAVARGKVLLVGKNVCRALSLANGAPLWRFPSGRPSGLGVLAGKTYYLPLQQGAVVALDLDEPRDSARIDARGAALGNLMFHGGDLWSQTAAELTAFPPLAGHLAQVEARVRADGNDFAARRDRGALRLDRGDVTGAIVDLRKALELKPGDEEARRRLLDALTQLLQRDFAAGEKYLAEYRGLLRVDVPADATADERASLQREYARNLTRCATLVAQGRERQGRVLEAVQAYREMYERTPADERLPLLDDPGVEVRADLWMQAQLAALVGRSNPEALVPLRDYLDREWKALAASDDYEGVARFAAMFGGLPGPLGAHGREARLRYAEHQAATAGRRNAAPLELELVALEKETDDPAFAARAIHSRARLLTRQGLLDDALAAYRALAKNYPQAKLGGRTAAEILADLGTDKRFLAALHETRPAWQGRKMQGKDMPTAGLTMSNFAMNGEFIGDAAPSARRWRFLLDAQKWQVRVLERETMLEAWNFSVPSLNIRNIGFDPDSFRYRIVGHLALFNVGPTLVAVDLVERRVRWSLNLLDEPVGFTRFVQFNPDGSFQVYSNEGRILYKLGLVGPVTRAGITVQMRAGLTALDLADGRVRWVRGDVPAQFEVYGDEQQLYLAEYHTDGALRGVRSVRAADGVTVSIPDAGDALVNKPRPVGRCLLINESGPNDELNLRFYDLPAGKDVWRKTFPRESFLLDSFVSDVSAVLTPKGEVFVFETRTGKEIKTLAIKAAHREGVTKASLIGDAASFYVALAGPPDPKLRIFDNGMYQFSDMRTATVNGMFYIFDRESGEVRAATRVMNQQVVLNRFEELPIVLFATTQTREVGAPGSGQQFLYLSTLSIDKQTGKRLFSKDAQNNNGENFHTLWVDAQAGLIDLIANNSRVRHQVAPK
jgi:outer membrane protein assembly factor BamB